MDIFAIGVTLLVIMLVLLVIRSLFSGSRNTNDFIHTPYEGAPPDRYSGSSRPDRLQNDDRGDWGGRDVSYDHDAGYNSDSDGGGDSGGDAGGGEGGGGGE